MMKTDWTEEDERRYTMAYEARARHHHRMRLLWLATLTLLTVGLIVLWLVR